MKQQYDVVVIGAGSGGLTAAVGFSKVGKKVLLVEREHMGGECTNTGCVPSKALLHAAKKGFHAPEAFSYVRNVVDGILADETPETFQAMGIDVVMGEAVFADKNSVTVTDTTYTFTTAVIATGSSPSMIKIDGLDERHILTNQNIFNLTDAPEKLLIIGGGPIGMEMAQAFAMLGSKVTVAERGEQFARQEDESIRPIVQAALEDLGIKIHTGAAIKYVEDKVAYFDQMRGDQTTGTFSVEFDNVLIAIGRTPNIPQGIEAAGIESTQQGVTVDKQHQTKNKRVYAVGDVAQRLKFTHMAEDTARQVVAQVTSKGMLRVSKNKAVPKVTYTTPEVAQVGLSWSEAIAKYNEDRLMRIEVSLNDNDRAKTDQATEGKLIVIARRLRGTVLGAHIIGPSAGEIITIFTLSIDQKISLWKLQKLIFAYPTYSLIVKKAADQFVGRQLAELKNDLAKSIKRHTPTILAALIWVTAIVALNRYQAVQGLTTAETAINIFDVITMTIWGPLLYVVIYAVRPVTFFPATALTILSGIFFGLLWGTVLTIIAATMAAGVAYTVGRFFGANLKLENSALGNYATVLREHTFSTVLTMRLIFMPFDLTSYAAGILRTKFIPFIAATFFGIILGTTTFVSIGASLNVEEFRANGFSSNLLEPQFLALSLLIFVTSIGVSKLLKQKKAK